MENPKIALAVGLALGLAAGAVATVVVVKHRPDLVSLAAPAAKK